MCGCTIRLRIPTDALINHGKERIGNGIGAQGDECGGDHLLMRRRSVAHSIAIRLPKKRSAGARQYIMAGCLLGIVLQSGENECDSLVAVRGAQSLEIRVSA